MDVTHVSTGPGMGRSSDSNRWTRTWLVVDLNRCYGRSKPDLNEEDRPAMTISEIEQRLAVAHARLTEFTSRPIILGDPR